MGMSAPCWLGLSSRPGFTQRREGVQGRYAPSSLGYLQAGVVTMVPTAVDTMSRWCSVGFIEDGLVCNLKKVTDHRIVVKCTNFTIVQIFVERERVYNDKFRKKANSNYELTINFSETRNKNAGDGVRTHDLQISEVKRNSDRKGGGLLCTWAQSVSCMVAPSLASSGRYFSHCDRLQVTPESVHPSE